ncbi:N-acetylneuraminate synthase family protein [Magnetospirillum aberrantis]|uniref:N-acetylneuraminic acid synthase n=1 Tax=Magnetospirillum aberrantis SpK TaxID=908842 RepID=A0A7C9UXN0_9PROT|nr:N-acetylneuraminate synthase family protein [Magnetospirillum aberrantis]NFV81170.1 N-acetylneuraminic acid synthase [Magnetospirillum aberrantis SpK]
MVAQPQFIAEVSSNHARDLGRCRAFVDAAADSGCDAVKFQLFRVRDLFAPEIVAVRPDIQARVEWELPTEFLAPIAEHCRARGILFACTPFSLDAVADLAPHVDLFKVASYEMIWPDLVRACAATGKPLVVSTGMADMDEVRAMVGWARDAGGHDLTLLHCVSNYPTKPEDANLAALDTLRRATGCAVGWSDHTRRPSVIHRAVHRWGASVVEFHFDLEGEGAEFAAGHCWLPGEIAPVIRDVREALGADGDGSKEPGATELVERQWRADPEDGLRPLKATRVGYRP